MDWKFLEFFIIDEIALVFIQETGGLYMLIRRSLDVPPEDHDQNILLSSQVVHADFFPHKAIYRWGTIG